MDLLKLNRSYVWLQNKNIFRWAFIFCLIFTIYFDGYVFPEIELRGLYLILSIILGFAFWNNRVLRIILAGVITLIRYYYAPTGFGQINVMLFITWVTYYLVTEGTGILILHTLKERENIINMTLALVKSLDSRDAYTAHHSKNVANYALMIAKEMNLSKKQCDGIYLGGLLHDIGKIGVPETILTKPSRLTHDEYEIIKQHPVTGYNTLKHISLFKANGILDMVLCHHERFDGTGYPKGLRGNQIPLVARIMALADAFDAMISQRVYRSNSDIEYAIDQIRKNSGSQFDPELADTFLKIFEREGLKILNYRIID